MSAKKEEPPTARDRSRLSLAWYRTVQMWTVVMFSLLGGIRATGRENVPSSGAVLMVCNHLSFWDVFALGALLHRPLNYVARSTLFKPLLGAFLRSLGAFEIQRDGMGAAGFKETLRRLRAGGIVVVFPEGTRSRDGELGPLKDGIGTLAARSKVPVLPVGLAGTYEAWPRSRTFPRPYPIRIHYGQPIATSTLEGLSTAEATLLIRREMEEVIRVAREGLKADLGQPPFESVSRNPYLEEIGFSRSSARGDAEN